MEITKNKRIQSVLKRIQQKYDHLSGKHFIHFIHIGKTGGSAVKYALKPYYRYRKYVIVPHSHSFHLSDAPEGEAVIFFLRDPVKRFTSGFYSRQRQGLPRHFYPWTEEEKVAFDHFTNPDQLALSLVSEDTDMRQKAITAMQSIHHVNSHFMDWFESEEYFLSRSNDIFFIGFQESLTEDFGKLKKKIGLPQEANLPNDPVVMHRNPVQKVELSQQSYQIMREWYKADYAFIDFCRDFMTKNLS
jgi:hypothetical protein